jgi:hypothetical protein
VTKVFSCSFNKARYNMTFNQQQRGQFGNDGRVAPTITDKLAVYCRTDKRTIDIFGIGRDSHGYRLATFKYVEVVNASPNPLVQAVPTEGTVLLRVDNDEMGPGAPTRPRRSNVVSSCWNAA